MPVRVEFLANRVDLAEIEFLEYAGQLLQCQFHAALETLHRRGFHRQPGFQAVLHRQYLIGKPLHGKFVRLADVFDRAAADVFAFGLGVHPRVIVFLRFALGLLEHLFHARHDFRSFCFSGFSSRCGGLLLDLRVGVVLFHAVLQIWTGGLWGLSFPFQEQMKIFPAGRMPVCRH